ncbi:MAG: MATE family efflux transporter [Clostridiales bacterium]|nr:MATE family efflux transporter [Clostridiales bacterium]
MEKTIPNNRVRKRKNDVNMTEGSIIRHLVVFAAPLLVGNIFQQLYNTVDTWVVGKYVSNEAFSAVGTVGPIINMLIGFFLGLSSGAGVVISQYYGAGRTEEVRKTVHTSLMMTILLGLLFTGLGIALIPGMLALMNTPAEVIPESTAYLTIYFAGVLGLMLYNMGAGILRAVGDSTRPFYYLVVSAVINTVLDLVFVLRFDMGVAGVAWATILAQGISAVLTLITLLRSDSCIRVSLRALRIHFDMLQKIIRVGIPAALQMAVTSFSNVFVQSYINYFGADCMSGWTAYGKIDTLLMLPMQSLALASTTFVGQNLGLGKVDRAKRGVRIALALSLVTAVILMIPVMVFAPSLVAFFNEKTTVVEYGTMFLRYISPFYILCCFNQIYSGALRGAGNTRAPMVIMLASFVVFRQIYLFVLTHFIANTILPVSMGYPAGWLVCSLLTYLYYRRADLTKSRIVETAEPIAEEFAAEESVEE